MSFADRYQSRYDLIIAPAIRSVTHDGGPLEPTRVDLSRSGDSILTEIIDGVAHSQLVLADVSTLGKDSVTGRSYRNGNVMYEVGLALACRQPEEVLLVRDDREPFLFDVSTIPHMQVDFADECGARDALAAALRQRLDERDRLLDARVEMAVAGMTTVEMNICKLITTLREGKSFGKRGTNTLAQLYEAAGIGRLLDKQVIRFSGQFQDGNAGYEPTPLGRVVAERAVRQVGALKGGESAAGAQRPEKNGVA
jgi:hypothetical protein